MDSEEPKEKKPIPKFTSFKPKPAPETTRRKADVPTGEKSERSRHKSRDSRPSHESRSRRRSRDRHSHRSRDLNHRSQLNKPAEATRNEKSDSGPSDLFVEDRKGDRYNAIYGTLHRYSVPQYNHGGRGNVLGLLNSYKIDRNLSDGATLVIKGGPGNTDSARQKNKKKDIFSNFNSRAPNLVRIRPGTGNDGGINTQKDYLPLNSSGGRKRRRLQGASMNDDDQRDYRSINPAVGSDQDLSSDLEEISDSDLRQGDEVNLDDNDEARMRQIELSKQVQEHPDDLDAWLKLIDHQDELIATVGGDRKRKFTVAETQSVADIKLSMYGKALAKLRTDTPRDRLLLGMLDEGSKIWDTKKLSKKWRDALKEYPQYISLWTKYLDFQQTQFIDFTYDQCRSIFTNSLKISSGSDLGKPENDNIKLYLFLRMTVFMREAGFTEHAIALWQAMLEFNCFVPQEYKAHKDSPDAKSAFEEFWESEVPRIGETGAKGWGGGNGTATEPKVDVSQNSVNKKAIFESWLACERERELNSRLPARTLDEVEEDDPYRVILFSDVQESLIPFSTSAASDLLINGFLTFGLLPPLLSDEPAEFVSECRGDPFLRNDLLDRYDGQEWLPSLHDDQRASTPMSLKFPLQNFIATTDTLFENGDNWYSSLEIWKRSYLENEGPLDPNWVRTSLRNLVEGNTKNDNLAEYTLAIEFICSPKDARKYGKSLLKKRPSSLRLYNAYALLECRNGNLDAAEHVWTTTLSMSKGFSPEEKLGRIVLWRTWLWELVNKRDYAKAVRLLLAIPDHEEDPAKLMERNSGIGTSLSPAEFLKIQRFTRETQEHALSRRKVMVFVNITECLALLFYITQSSDIYSALEVYRKADDLLKATLQMPSRSIFFSREILHQAKAKLLHHHIKSTRKYKPATVSDELKGSIKLFPQNTIFLSLFAQNETARFLRVDDGVRALTRDLLATDQHGNSAVESIIPHFFSVFSELERGVAASSAEPWTAGKTSMTTAAANSVRAAFEHSFGTRAGRSSAALWKLYVVFEISQGRADLARQVFYRGVRACPWAKALVMVAFTHLREIGVMSFEELRKVYNVLVEKELRIHVDLEEVFEDYDTAVERETASGTQAQQDIPPVDMPYASRDGDSY